ncbi:hypothetical protein G6F39_001752 [Rhizopus arrhizus]|nr:hypothetical protein G6F39_001752 [Rhizopus arrhizus]
MSYIIFNLIYYCSKVRIIDSLLKNDKEGYLAIVIHGSQKEEQEACLLLLEESSDLSMPPIVLKTIPIYSDLSIHIAQSDNLQNKSLQQSVDLMVTFSLNDDSAHVTFPEKDIMSDMLLEVKRLVNIAANHDLSSHQDNSHEWSKTYSKFGGKRQQKVNKTTTHNHLVNQKKPIPRSNSLPISEEANSALKYVLPLKREDTIEKIQLKRTRTVATTRERKITLKDAKDHWINSQLMKKEDEFVHWEKTSAFVGTWNVHGSLPNASLKEWLQGTGHPDFYVIGLQEMETNTEAYIRYDPTKENAWVQGILDTLGDDYYKVVSKQLVTMLLIVVAKKSHKSFISETQVTWAGVGLMNMMGNKGGIAVRFRFHDSYLCFVTSHLAAFTDKTEKRNQDFTELSKRLLFTHVPDHLTDYVSYFWNNGGDEGVTFLENNNVIRDWRVEASIYHSDFLIWCGDLNYRVNLHESVIKNWLRQDRLDVLLDYDQLSIERKAGRTFPMFEEGPIHFPPTYKYDAGTNQYDTSEKRRAPSWTDRVLWKKERFDSPRREQLELVDYNHCMNMMMSDHKPVRALVALQIRKINSRLLQSTHDALVQQLKQSQDVQPRGEISSSFIDFEKVQFLEHKEKTILLQNTGQVLTLFKFLPKGDQTTILPPWLQVSPTSGVLAPGERVVIRFEVMVDPSISTPLNRGEQKMEDILILRLENSKDFFISVSGDYVPTCFGVPLELLSEMSVPISETAAQNLLQQQQQQQQVRPSSGLNQIDLPKELWKVMNFLWNSNMFRIVPIDQLCARFRKLGINNAWILGIHYPDRNVTAFLFHNDYATDFTEQLR